MHWRHSAHCCRSRRRACTGRERAGGPGHVLRPHARGAPSLACMRCTHQHRVLLSRLRTPRMGACARTPSHLPRHSGGMRRLCSPTTDAAGRWWCPRAQAPFGESASGCSANPVLTRLRLVPLDGAPRAWAGERGHRHRPGVATFAGVSRRTAAKGRNQPASRPDLESKPGRRATCCAGTAHPPRTAHS
jgi:hypothetical protein